MRHAISLLISLFLTTSVFLKLATLNTDQIHIQPSQTKPTHFYKLFKPKLKKKQVKRKKPLQKKQKPLPSKQKSETKPTKQKNLSEKGATVSSPNIDENPVVELTDLDQEAVVMAKIMPEYPEIARKSGVECRVLLEMIINEKGRVDSAKAVHVSKPGYGFEINALKAAKKLKFVPILQNDRPVKVKIIYPIEFVLLE